MTEQAAPWTIGRLLTWTTDFLKQHGAESPRLDAEVLLAHARGCERIQLYASFDDVADESLREAFRSLVKQRAAGAPVAYLVGHREFYSRDFEVTSDVLIPRPETEFIIVALLDLVQASTSTDAPLRIVDVGTGSGVLAICAALELPAAEVVALDISTAALEVAQRNAARHGVADRIRFVVSDLFESLDAAESFDYIISNPPYIGESERPELARDVVDFEPHVALFAGHTGLDILNQLVAQAPPRLTSGGWLLSEFSPPQRDALQQFVESEAQLDDLRFITDLSKQPRVMEVQRR